MTKGLLIFELLFMLVSPLLALALPITKGSKLGWSLWALSILGIALHWSSYFHMSDIGITVGDTVEYNGKKPEFARAVAISSIYVIAFGFYVLQSFIPNNVTKWVPTLVAPAALILSISTYYATLQVLRDQDWGTGRCVVIPDGHESASCRREKWMSGYSWKGER